jgi:hypothetical protein
MLPTQPALINHGPIIFHTIRPANSRIREQRVIDGVVALCQEHELVARDLVLLDCFADDELAAAEAVDVGLGIASNISRCLGSIFPYAGGNTGWGKGGWGLTNRIPCVDSPLEGVLK